MLENLGGFGHLLRSERVQADAVARHEEGAENDGASCGDMAVRREAEQQPLVVGDADRTISRTPVSKLVMVPPMRTCIALRLLLSVCA